MIRGSLEVENVSVTYGRRSLLGRVPEPTVKDVSFSVNSGTTVGIVGESGSGKSTLARSLVGLQRTSSGTVSLDGTPIAPPQAGKPGPVQMIFQDPGSSLDPHLTILDSVREPLRLREDIARNNELATARRLLGSVGLKTDLHQRRPRFLSGGQKQRAAIARALATDPKILVADEPVSALDVSVQAQVLNLLLELQEERGLTLVLISHDLAVVNHMSDFIGVMSQGALVEWGTADQVVFHPQHEYTKTLINAVPGHELPGHVTST